MIHSSNVVKTREKINLFCCFVDRFDFCQDATEKRPSENLGQVLFGERIASSPYKVTAFFQPSLQLVGFWGVCEMKPCWRLWLVMSSVAPLQSFFASIESVLAFVDRAGRFNEMEQDFV